MYEYGHLDPYVVNKLHSLRKPAPDIVELNKSAVFYHNARFMRIAGRINGIYYFTKRDGKIVFSPIYTVYSLVAVITAATLRIYYEPTTTDNILLLVVYIEAVSTPILCFSAVILGLLNLNHMKATIQMTLKLSMSLSFAQINRYYWYQLIMITTCYLLTIVYFVCDVFWTPVFFAGHIKIMKAPEMYLYLSILLLRVQFILIVYLLRTLMANIVSDLNATTTLQRLNDIISLYEDVASAADSANMSFGGALAISTTLTTVEGIYAAYLNVRLSDLGDSRGSLYFLWIINEFLQQWLMLTVVELFMWQVSRVPIAVHKVIQITENINLKRQLNAFSSSLLQRNLTFSISGLALFDYTLLFTMVGGVTTYLIVLMQFQKAGEE